jgi:hypothetical protein
VTVCCERGDEPSVSVKCDETVDWLKASDSGDGVSCVELVSTLRAGT